MSYEVLRAEVYAPATAPNANAAVAVGAGAMPEETSQMQSESRSGSGTFVTFDPESHLDNPVREGERMIAQEEVYVMPESSVYHFDADCSTLGGRAIERDWDRKLFVAPPVARRLGGMDMNRARALAPCPQCAGVFQRFRRRHEARG